MTADFLGKKELDEPCLQLKGMSPDNNYKMSFYNITVKDNNRRFIKSLHKIRNDLKEESLKRFNNFDNIDKHLSYKILNANNEFKIKDRKFTTYKENNNKNLKFKKMLNKILQLKN